MAINTTFKVLHNEEYVDIYFTTLAKLVHLSDDRNLEEALAAIENKINNTLESIGKEEGFMYIFDVQAQAILYFSPKSVDVLPMVKRKLNLR